MHQPLLALAASVQFNPPLFSRICIRVLLLLLGLVPCGHATPIKPGAEQAIVVISNSALDYHNTFTDTFIRAFRSDNIHEIVVSIDAASEDVADILKSGIITPKLIITVGKSSASIVSKLEITSPILYTLISKDSYQQLAPQTKHTALFIDQPIQRMLGLIPITLPKTRDISVILGPTSSTQKNAIREQAAQLSLTPHFYRIDSRQQLNAILYEALSDTEVLVSLPDPLVVNRQTAKNIILSAYLRRIPILGYSESLVKAGALMAVYSTPEQLGLQAAQLGAAILGTHSALNKGPYYPSDFSIAINYQVARSLGLEIDSQRRIKQQLLRVTTRP